MFDSQRSLIGTRPSDLWIAMPAEEPPTRRASHAGRDPIAAGSAAGPPRPGRGGRRSAAGRGPPPGGRRRPWGRVELLRVCRDRPPAFPICPEVPGAGRPLHVGDVVQLHAEVVANPDAGDVRFALEHAVPAVEAGRRVLRLARVAVVPFLAGDLGADAVGHDGAVSGSGRRSGSRWV